VEPAVQDRLEDAVRAGRIAAAPGPHFRAVPGLPHGARGVLAHGAGGRCVFLETGGLCAVHRQAGAGALPSACRDFPRLVTRSPLGVSITLSHYCPTAAALLFRSTSPPGTETAPAVAPGAPPRPESRSSGASADPALAIETDPEAFPPDRPYDGLDALEAFPPFLRPGVLTSWAAHARWEAHTASTLAREDLSPEDAVAALERVAEDARRWSLDEGPYDGFFERCLERAVEPPAGEAVGRAWPLPEASRAWNEAMESIPEGHPRPAPPLALSGSDGMAGAGLAGLVSEGWEAHPRPIRRWLAAKSFASWLALQGEGLRTTVAGLRLALGVLRAEAARECRVSGRPLDGDGLREAVRRADLVLAHLVDPAHLARRLSRVESAEDVAVPW